MSDDSPVAPSRRDFLAGVALAGALPAVHVALAAQSESPPSAAEIPRTAGSNAARKPGSDYMVDVMRSLGLEFTAANPGSSFRALQESIVNYAGNENPEFLTCMHEESSVAFAHGFAKVLNRPISTLVHGTVGLQHATMALYNAWCDLAPVVVIGGNPRNAEHRRPGIEWVHSAQDPAAIVRDYTKWDDQPASLPHFGESMVRGYKIAMTPPQGPVVIIADGELQEEPVKGSPHVPKLTPPSPPQGEDGAIRETAKILLAAEHPVIVVDRLARTLKGMDALVELAEILGAPVIDLGGRMNFPTRHDLCQTSNAAALVKDADAILGLEVADFWGVIHRYIDNVEQSTTLVVRPEARLVTINSRDAFLRSNYQDFQRYPEVDISMAADGEATLPALVEAVRVSMTAAGKAAAEQRRAALRADRLTALNQAKVAASYAWDASPISTARMCAEIWNQINGLDWAVVSDNEGVSNWPHRLWNFQKHYQFIGNSGGGGLGYGLSAAVGAALAHRSAGRFVVNIQSDGDLMYTPGMLWTAVHHKIPLLNVMHNNRAYHQEIMHIQRMANRNNRGPDRASIGTTIEDPAIDYATLAKSMGMWAEGPITNPADLGPALRRAIAVVKRGEPALLDVVCQPR